MDVEFLFNNVIAKASVVELVWLFNATVGLTLSFRNLLEARADRKALGVISNGRRAIAINSIILETILTVKFSLYIVAGLFAISTSPTGPPTVTGTIVVFVLLTSAILLTIISWSNRRLSKYLLTHGLQNRDAKGKFTKSTDTTGKEVVE